MQRHSVAGKGVGQQRESKSLGWATVYTEPDLHRPRTLPSFKQFKKSSGHKAYLLHICNGLSCICHCSMASSQDTPFYRGHLASICSCLWDKEVREADLPVMLRRL